MKPSPVPDIASPEDLLRVARELLATGDPKLRRAVVLEAMTALESSVHRVVFDLLKKTLDPILYVWLRNRTKNDFDTRVKVLTPVALQQTPAPDSGLLDGYERARDIRHDVIHAGRRPSRENAEYVLKTVEDWLEFLGSTGDVSRALADLKRYIESSQTVVPDGLAAERIVRDYFQRSSVAHSSAVKTTIGTTTYEWDLVLRFGRRLVVVEVKRIPAGATLGRRAEMVVERFASRLAASGTSRGALVILSESEPTEAYNHVKELYEGMISVVVVHVPRP